MYNIYRTLTYGHRLQISEGNIRIPLDDPNRETWVTKSEELNTKKGKRIFPVKKEANPIPPKDEKPNLTGDEQMTTKEHCHQEPGYFSYSPKPVPQASTTWYFNAPCCCEDGTPGLLEALLLFALAKKAANLSILSVAKQWSPNGACSALTLGYLLIGNVAQTQADIDAIGLYYLSLLGY